MDQEFDADLQTYEDEQLAVRMTEVAAAERQYQVQMMLTKQLDIGGSLEQQIQQKKSFTRGSTVKSIAENTKGQLSLQDFVSLQEEHESLQELRDKGLTEDEIVFKLHQEGKRSTLIQPAKRGNLSADPSIQSKRLKAVNSQISQQQEEQAGTSSSSVEAHVDEDVNVGQQSRKGIFSQLSLSRRFVHPDDPINHLQIIEDKLFSKISEGDGDDDKSSHVYQGCDPKPETYIKDKGLIEEGCQDTDTRGSELDDVKSYIHNPWVPVSSGETHLKCNCLSSIILKEKTCKESGSNRTQSSSTSVTCSEGTSSDRQSTCLRCKKLTSQAVLSRCESEQTGSVTQRDEAGPVRQLHGQVSAISVEEIKRNRLTEDEIRQLDRFKNHSPGVPSKVLYLKNLNKQVTEDDLVSVFIHFQDADKPKLVYRLLSGRMRGQAFVTFPDSETATSAMKLINGYKLKGRPIIVQYGKQPTK